MEWLEDRRLLAVLIDNDGTDANKPGYFSVMVDNGGSLVRLTDRITAQGASTPIFTDAVIFDFLNFVDPESDGSAFDLSTTTITPAQQATLISDDRVRSMGTFPGENGTITWTVETYFNGTDPTLFNTVTFMSTSPQTLGNLRFINYLDEDVEAFDDDILFKRGSVPLDDLEVFTVDSTELVGFSQSGTYQPGPDLSNATFEGWAADEFPMEPNRDGRLNPQQLRGLITGGVTTYIQAGNIDEASLPPSTDPLLEALLGEVNGPEDVTTAFAWKVSPTATMAKITTKLRLLTVASIRDASQVEGSTPALVFPVRLSVPSGQTISIRFDTMDGTATAGEDYTAAVGILTFAPGDTTGFITVSLLNDSLDENSEDFFVNLTNVTPNLPPILDGQAVGTIIDDDLPPVAVISDAAPAEGSGLPAEFQVTLSAPSGKPITIAFSTADGIMFPARAGQDYTTTAGVIFFAPGDASPKSITVPVLDDFVCEPDQTFLLNLFNLDPSTVTIPDPQAVGTIIDNEPLPQVTIGDATAIEEGDSGSVNAIFSVTLSLPCESVVTVVSITASGSAMAGSDFAFLSNTLTFLPLQTSQSIGVAILGDLVEERDETFVVNLTGGADVIIADSQGIGTILNEDAFVVTGADAGGGPHVKVLDRQTDGFTDPTAHSFFAYDARFTGGVRVALADVNRDGTPDIITGAGPGGGPHVRVFDGATGQPLPGLIGSFYAYNPLFGGGVFVAAGDINGDGRADVVTGADAGGGPHVRSFDGLTGAQLPGIIGSFFAYKATMNAGVRVAAGDLNGDGRAEIITGTGPGYENPLDRSGFNRRNERAVQVFSTPAGYPGISDAASFLAPDVFWFRAFDPFPSEPNYRGGVHLAVGSFGGRPQIIASKANGDGRVDSAFAQAHLNGPPGKISLYDPGFARGMVVAATSATSFSGDASLPSANGYFNNRVIRFTSGLLIGQTRTIVDYRGADRTFVVAPALLGLPAAGSRFELGPREIILNAYPGFGGSVRIALVDLAFSANPGLITGAGPGGGPHVKVFQTAPLPPDSLALTAIDDFFAYDPLFGGGVWVAG